MELDVVLQVPVPVRFLFMVLGPDSPHISYHEIGRAVSTMMAERVRRPPEDWGSVPMTPPGSGSFPAYIQNRISGPYIPLPDSHLWPCLKHAC